MYVGVKLRMRSVKDWEALGIWSSSSKLKLKLKLNVSKLIKPGFLKLQTTKNSSSSSSFMNCLHSMSPILCDSSSFMPKEEDESNKSSEEGLPSISGGIVALGKFDALHVGHRQLAVEASQLGTPFLLSFVGMSQVFGWPPRPPVVAKCDRQRVLSSWAPLCRNVAPQEFLLDFSRVRHLTPTQFVEKLSNELGVLGVVAGENYRFGYKAAGDASELVRLCNLYGMKAYIINSVMDKNKSSHNSNPQDKKDKGQVSSTRVRDALSKGQMKYVSELLGRHHRLVFSAEFDQDLAGSKTQILVPKSSLLNLPPKDGLYHNCSLIAGDEIELPCRVLIDPTHIHLESDRKDSNIHDIIKGVQFLGIEFKG
ncbi:hypothetical protein RND81_14G001700 [Saponaria officinalis]|uniref:FAD synthase n=1 Tax=Saponaria officinalis TaxID=3572 RepID=A0AAW1GJQ7_SAPOF